MVETGPHPKGGYRGGSPHASDGCPGDRKSPCDMTVRSVGRSQRFPAGSPRRHVAVIADCRDETITVQFDDSDTLDGDLASGEPEPVHALEPDTVAVER